MMNSHTRVQASTQEVASFAQRLVCACVCACLPHTCSCMGLVPSASLLAAQLVTPGQTLLSLHLFAPHQFGSFTRNA